jgi:hypothetical protein
MRMRAYYTTHTLCVIVPLDVLWSSLSKSMKIKLHRYGVKPITIVEMVMLSLAQLKFWPQSPLSETTQQEQVLIQFEEAIAAFIEHLDIDEQPYSFIWERQHDALALSLFTVMIKVCFLMESFLSKLGIDLYESTHHLELIKTLPGHSVLIRIHSHDSAF